MVIERRKKIIEILTILSNMKTLTTNVGYQIIKKTFEKLRKLIEISSFSHQPLPYPVNLLTIVGVQYEPQYCCRYMLYDTISAVLFFNKIISRKKMAQNRERKWLKIKICPLKAILTNKKNHLFYSVMQFESPDSIKCHQLNSYGKNRRYLLSVTSIFYCVEVE